MPIGLPAIARALGPWLERTGQVLASWAALLTLEVAVVRWLWHDQFVALWESRLALTHVVPLALSALWLPAAALAALAPRLEQADRDPSTRAAAALGAAVLGAITASGVSGGRRLAGSFLRVPTVIGVGLVFGFVGFGLAFALARLARSDRSCRWLGPAAVALAFSAWTADAFVLPRLYPTLHSALAVGCLGCAALAPLTFRLPRGAAVGFAVVSVFALVLAPLLSKRLATADNLRIVLVEHAPLLGRAERLATWVWPPPPLDEANVEPPEAKESPGAPHDPTSDRRALYWAGRDVLLVTVDALRADHVGAYGYPRATTPRIDALAAEGARFEAAYCATPHTSYSVASIMTGKYMRPLVALGLGADSETWASFLRRYGYRTAGFYPPAVFFIDGERLAALRERAFDFEYRKEEFASPELRLTQVREWLEGLPTGVPVFAWLHLFEPHEPYVDHAEHPFGRRAVDRYDSEIAHADAGVGKIVELFRSKRPRAVVILTADHGEEFGEHGGQFHGTTVYEEQVRVPMIVVGEGVSPRVVTQPVQTIDLLPTVLRAMGLPRPARIRGRDLGMYLGAPGAESRASTGFAFSEVERWALVADGAHRLLCLRDEAACALYDVEHDPSETRDRSAERPEVVRNLKRTLAQLEREHGRFEEGAGAEWPAAIRRGLQGDVDAAEDAAALLSDASVTIRRKAAEVCFELKAPATLAELRRASTRDEDAEVRMVAALARVRLGDEVEGRELPGLDAPVSLRRLLALAFAERGDARGAEELLTWWKNEPPREFERQRELVRAFGKLRLRTAVPALERALGDVRLRPVVVDALAEIGDVESRHALARAWKNENVDALRRREVEALLALGARKDALEAITYFATRPEPQADWVRVVARAGLLDEHRVGKTSGDRPVSELQVAALLRSDTARTLWVHVLGPEEPSVTDGRGPLQPSAAMPLSPSTAEERVHFFPLAPGRGLEITVRHAPGILAAWVVPAAEEKAGETVGADGGLGGNVVRDRPRP